MLHDGGESGGGFAVRGQRAGGAGGGGDVLPLLLGGAAVPVSAGIRRSAAPYGCCLLGVEKTALAVTAVTCGRIVDLGIADANNMGAAMAPAAASTIETFLRDTGTGPEDYDLILTGDLGKVGKALLLDLLKRQGIDLSRNHDDCGLMLYDEEQDVHAGGSGCGCSASVLCGYVLPRIASGVYKDVLFAATGALMSPTSVQQGESIPGIAHLVHLSHKREG